MDLKRHAEAQARFRKTEKGKAARLRYRKSEAYKRIRVAYTKRWRIRNKIKNTAHWMVAQALKFGKIKKGKCEKCGSGNVVAHHHDYLAPLDIRWLCLRHHNEVHCQPAYKKVMRI